MPAVTRLSLWGTVARSYPFEQGEGPNEFVFISQLGVARSTPDVTSNQVEMSGISGSLDVTLSGDASAEYSKNGGAWVTDPTTAVNGDTFRLRVDASPDYNTGVSATLTVGEVEGTFLVVTLKNPAAVIRGVGKITRLHTRR